jgi:6-phosphogluconolactonase
VLLIAFAPSWHQNENMSVVISKNIEELSQNVAEWMFDYIHKTLLLRDRFTIVLSGGSTPRKLYLLLASDQFKNRIDWQKLHVFWGDERYVAFTDDRNNAKMAFDTLLDHVPVPGSQIHIMRTDIDPEKSAKEYEGILRDYFPEAASYWPQAVSSAPPQDSRLTTHHSRLITHYSFDLVLLGLGDNSHTLSLFPGEEVIHEKDRWVRSVFVKEVNMQRITLTAPVVNLSRRIAFLVSGQDKADAVAHILSDGYDPDRYPAQVIKPVNGELFWFLDDAAATRAKK